MTRKNIWFWFLRQFEISRTSIHRLFHNKLSILFFQIVKTNWNAKFPSKRKMWIDLTWLDLTLIPLKKLTKLKRYRGCTGSQDFSWGGQLDNEPLKQLLTTHLRVKVIVSRNQQQEFHTLLAIIVTFIIFLTKPFWIISNKEHSYHDQISISKLTQFNLGFIILSKTKKIKNWWILFIFPRD